MVTKRSLKLIFNAMFCYMSLTVLTTSAMARNQQAHEEILFPSEEFSKLDTFEGLNLEDADKLFTKKDYKGAFAAYKAYSDEFPKGKALAYSLFRMGRCLHLMKKRNSAIRAYQEVVDYFPNDVRYAAGALYHMGEAHKENGDERKCLATWAKMVKDKDYVGQPKSGTALIYLATAMDNAKKYDEAATYRIRIAVNFRVSNSKAAHEAKEAVRFYYAIRKPSHETFKVFYKDVGGWHRNEKLNDLDNSAEYWDSVLHSVLNTREIPFTRTPVDQEMRKASAKYWLAKLGGKLPKNDTVQWKVIDLHYLLDGDKTAWVSRMNAQYKRSTSSVVRLKNWVRQFGRNPKAQMDFIGANSSVLSGAKYTDITTILSSVNQASRGEVFNKFLTPGIGAMKQEDKIKLLAFLTEWRMKMYNEAKVVLMKLDLRTLTDTQLISVANMAHGLVDESVLIGYFDRMKDKSASTKAKYDYFYKHSQAEGRNFNKDMGEKALAMIPEVKKIPEYAQAVLWPRAKLLDRLGQYAEAIKAYRATNKQPDATWAVSECQVRMKQYPEAIKTIKGLESIGGSVASRACYRIAEIYKTAGDKGKEVDQLRLVLRRYPSSGESSAAHRRLEDLGAKITGGKATAEE